MKSTCIISPYFGEFPYYFSLWKDSAQANPDINWLIFTDQEKSHKDKNIEYVNFSLNQLNDLASKKLNTKVEIKQPYKICDLRLAFPVVFDDYLKNFEFWGHCDLDVVWGDMEKFLGMDYVWKHDIISADHRGICGPFSLFKNAKKTNYIWKSCKNYIKILNDDKYEGNLVDEISFVRLLEFDPSLLLFGGHSYSFGHKLICLQKYNNSIDKDRTPAYWHKGKLFIEPLFEQLVVKQKNFHGFGAETMLLHARSWHYVDVESQSIHHKDDSKEILKKWQDAQ